MFGVLCRRNHLPTVVVICTMAGCVFWMAISGGKSVVPREQSSWAPQIFYYTVPNSPSSHDEYTPAVKEAPGSVDTDVPGASVWMYNKDPETLEVPVKRQEKVIIVGYKRGGTSFLSYVLHSHPEVFFVYEPLWYFQDPDFIGVAITDHKTMSLSEHIKKPWRMKSYIPEPLSYIRSLLDCQWSNETLNFVKYAAGSRDVRALNHCLKNRTVKHKSWCFQNATRDCIRKSVTSLKTVRLSVAESGKILAQDPDVKILFIARDPRGNSNSYNQTLARRGQSSDEPIAMNPDYFYGDRLMQEKCRIMNADAKALVDLSKTYRDRILTVRYEDVADDPVGMAAKLLRFVHLSMRPEVTNSLAEMTQNNNVTKISFTVTRSNSSSTAEKWREQLDYKAAQKIQQQCLPFFQLMKYRIFDTEDDMRNNDIPFRDSVFGEGINTIVK